MLTCSVPIDWKKRKPKASGIAVTVQDVEPVMVDLELTVKPPGHYVMDKRCKPVEATVEEWAAFMKSGDHAIKHSLVGHAGVYTTFLGTPHGYDGEHPVLFETTVSGSSVDEYWVRTTSVVLALQDHAETVIWIQRLLDVPNKDVVVTHLREGL